MKMLKKADILLIFLLLCLSLAPLVLRQIDSAGAVYADITVDGVPVRHIRLHAHEEIETFTLITPDGHQNTIQSDGSTIAVIDADCPDRLCVKAGSASQTGDIIACLPHKLLIEVKETGSDGRDAAIHE